MDNRKEWKSLGALLLVTAAFFTGNIITANAETVKQDFTNADEGYCITEDFGITECTVKCDYEIIENQTWDDVLGTPIYDNHIRITGVTFQTNVKELPPPTDEYGETIDLTRWSSPDIDWYYTIPASIDGMPVEEIDAGVYLNFERGSSISYNCTANIHLTLEEGTETIQNINCCEYTSDYRRMNIQYASLTLPNSAKTIGSLTCTAPDIVLSDNLTEIGTLDCPNADITLPEGVKTIESLSAKKVTLPEGIESIGTLSAGSVVFNGTCEQLFSIYPRIADDTVYTCKDGYISSEEITYEGTCAEWVKICPAALQTRVATCADGTAIADPPLPEDPHYRFDKPTKTAVYVGGEEKTITALSIPAVMEGYTVTGIASDALVGYPELTAVEIPATVTSIGEHAVGYWKNTDGSYSKMSKVVIYCEEGSTAQEYAIENGLSYNTSNSSETTPPVTATEESTTMLPTITVNYGDVNCDGELSVMDVILLNRYLMIGAQITPKGMINADVDMNDEIDAVDSLNILKAVVKLITLPIE